MEEFYSTESTSPLADGIALKSAEPIFPVGQRVQVRTLNCLVGVVVEIGVPTPQDHGRWKLRRVQLPPHGKLRWFNTSQLSTVNQCPKSRSVLDVVADCVPVRVEVRRKWTVVTINSAQVHFCFRNWKVRKDRPASEFMG